MMMLDKTRQRIGKSQANLLNHLKSNPYQDIDTISKEIGMLKHILSRLLHELKDKDLIEFSSNHNGWVIGKEYRNQLVWKASKTIRTLNWENSPAGIAYKEKYKLEHKEDRDKVNKRRLKFKGKHILLDENPKTGICSICKKSVHKKEIEYTSWHHLKYDPKNPLNHTVELCVTCHRAEHKKTHVYSMSKAAVAQRAYRAKKADYILGEQ